MRTSFPIQNINSRKLDNHSSLTSCMCMKIFPYTTLDQLTAENVAEHMANNEERWEGRSTIDILCIRKECFV